MTSKYFPLPSTSEALEHWNYPRFREALDQAMTAKTPAPSVAVPAMTNNQPDLVFDVQDQHDHAQRLPMPAKKRKKS